MTSKQPFETVVAQHGATVLRVCRALLGPADADDAWSETFLSSMWAYPDLPEDANVEAWLVRIAHRKAIDVLRAAGRRAIPTERVPDAPAPPAPDGPDPDLAAAVTRLPPKQRQAVATTTWPACPTPMSPPSSAAAPTPPAVPPPTASPPSAAPTHPTPLGAR